MNNNAIKKWSDLRGLVVYVPKEGKSLGTVKDFYFKEGTNSVYALLVHTRVEGDYALPVSAIKTIDAQRLTIDNANMLIRALPPLPTSKNLSGRKVVGETGGDIGTVGEVWLGTEPPNALYLAAIELAPPAGRSVRHPKAFTADAVASYEDEKVVIHDQVARRLR